jgi:hypothetical protein
MFLAVRCQHASGTCQSHSRPVLSLREALRKYVELSPSTPPFLTLPFHEKDLTPTPNLLRIWSILPLLRHILSLWSCYSSFTFKSNLLHMIIRYFLGINQNSLSIVFIVKKNISYRIDWETSIHGTHGYLSSSENIVVNPSCQ